MREASYLHFLRGWPSWVACCLIVTAPLMGWRENVAAWCLLGTASSLERVRRDGVRPKTHRSNRMEKETSG